MGFSKNKWFYIKYEGNWFSAETFDLWMDLLQPQYHQDVEWHEWQPNTYNLSMNQQIE